MGRVSVGLALLALLGPLSGCGLFDGLAKDAGATSSVVALNENARSVFARTLLPQLRENGRCSSCHSTTGVESARPFADADVNTAYHAAVVYQLIDFRNPAESRVLDYMSNGHCGSSVCFVTDRTVQQEFESAVEDCARAQGG